MNQSNLFPDSEFVSGNLTDTEIKDSIERGFLILKNTFSETCLESSSYDIRVGHKGILGGEGKEIDLQKDSMELSPGSYGGVVSFEKLKLPPNVMATIGSKRALSYEGIILLTGSIVDAGYEGHLLFGLYNASQKKVVIRKGKKICNIVFERLSKNPVKQVMPDPNLAVGSFPDAFVDRMVNMDVLPWMQISERVSQIEQITKDILDLKARYDDVLQPIKDLTKNVESLSQDVSNLTNQSKNIAKEVEGLTKNATENAKQISELTASLTMMVSQVSTINTNVGKLEKVTEDNKETVTDVKSEFKLFRLIIYIVFAILLVVLGAFLPTIFSKIFE